MVREKYKARTQGVYIHYAKTLRFYLERGREALKTFKQGNKFIRDVFQKKNFRRSVMNRLYIR